MQYDFNSKSLDNSFIPAVESVIASQVTSSVINQQQVVQGVQVYQPTFQLETLQQYYSLLPQDAASIANAITMLKGGMSGFLLNLSSRCQVMANAAAAAAATNASSRAGGFQPAVSPPAKPNPKPGGGGGGGYNCQTDGALSFGLGTAFLVVLVSWQPPRLEFWRRPSGVPSLSGVGSEQAPGQRVTLLIAVSRRNPMNWLNTYNPFNTVAGTCLAFAVVIASIYLGWRNMRRSKGAPTLPSDKLVVGLALILIIASCVFFVIRHSAG